MFGVAGGGSCPSMCGWYNRFPRAALGAVVRYPSAWEGAAWDGFVVGLGLTLLLDTFQVPFLLQCGGSWLDGTFHPTTMLLPLPCWPCRPPSSVPCVPLGFAAALKLHRDDLMGFLGNPVWSAPEEGHSAMCLRIVASAHFSFAAAIDWCFIDCVASWIINYSWEGTYRVYLE